MAGLDDVPPPRHLALRRSVPLAAPPGGARETALAYLSGAGYAALKESPDRFARGSRILTPVAFSPRLWHAEVTLKFTLLEFGVTFNIETTGQVLSKGEREFWEREADALAGSVRTGVPQPPPPSWPVLANNLATTLLMFALTGLACAAGIVLGEWLGGGLFILFAGLGCAAAGFLLYLRIATAALGHFHFHPEPSENERKP